MDTRQQTGAIKGVLWVEEPMGRRRTPDPVRTSAVRAGLIVSVTLVEAVVAILGALGGSWITVPAVLAVAVSTVVATWAVLDVSVTQQVWNQRHGVISTPLGAARELRAESRSALRAASGPKGARTGRIRHRPHLLSRV
jgi:hypothetical protein